jgi:hypothetical protein
MFRLSQSPNPNLREAAYLIFSDLSGTRVHRQKDTRAAQQNAIRHSSSPDAALLDDAFLKPYLPILKNTLNQGLNDEKSVKARSLFLFLCFM